MSQEIIVKIKKNLRLRKSKTHKCLMIIKKC